MNGIQMMLKAMGINADEVLKSVGEFRNAAVQCAEMLRSNSEALARIEARLANLENSHDQRNTADQRETLIGPNGSGH